MRLMKRTKMQPMSPINPIIFWAGHCVTKTVDHHEKWSAKLALSIEKSRRNMRGVSTQTLEKDTSAAIWLIEALYQASLTGYPLGLRLGKLGRSEITSSPSCISSKAVRRAVDAAHKLGWINLE